MAFIFYILPFSFIIFFGFQFGNDIEVHLLCFFRQGVCINLQLRNEVDKRIDSSFCLKKFIQDNYFFLFQDTITA